ncbi:hypothetical protein EJK80_06190 [Corynebacterium phoceense]|uniref:Uncharacterized protein n=1 Tax=Corynebacterium phoceense TaxID=1686286 RepID=A0A540R771_9CORY|nr:hypothetical protein [Corynebacterium phoceense]TQE43595.1 hypothetical protein EJK80_06190 [Corynebacterium phoceense]
MTINANTIRELLEQATPGPWHVAMLDLHRETGVIDNEHAQANQRLAALAPELAQDWLHMRHALEETREIVKDDQADFGKWDTMDAQSRLRWEIQQIHNILNGDI